MKIDIKYKPSQTEQDILLNGLIASNKKKGMPEMTDCWVFAYDDNNQIVGGCKFLIGQTSLWVAMLWIGESRQNQGLGKKLLSVAEQEAKKQGCQFAYLDTFEFQKAVLFYKKCGYKLIAQVEPMEGNDGRYFLKKTF